MSAPGRPVSAEIDAPVEGDSWPCEKFMQGECADPYCGTPGYVPGGKS